MLRTNCCGLSDRPDEPSALQMDPEIQTFCQKFSFKIISFQKQQVVEVQIMICSMHIFISNISTPFFSPGIFFSSDTSSQYPLFIFIVVNCLTSIIQVLDHNNAKYQT